MITEFVLHDVRCFQGEQRANLGPITLLVGENSTGKTTFLGCYSVLHRLISRPAMSGAPVDFNQEPFSMGSFRDIVRSGRRRTGRIEQFKLGFSVTPRPSSELKSYPLLVTFSEAGSQPVITSIHIQFKEQVFLNIRRSSSGGTVLTIPERKASIDYSIDNWIYLLDHLLRPNGPLLESEDVRAVVESLSGLLRGRKSPAGWRLWLPDISHIVPIAPLRSKPKRTYDPVREAASSDGEHVPMLMMRLDRTEKGDWSSLHDDLMEFGQDSGLFFRHQGTQPCQADERSVSVAGEGYGPGPTQISWMLVTELARACRSWWTSEEPARARFSCNSRRCTCIRVHKLVLLRQAKSWRGGSMS